MARLLATIVRRIRRLLTRRGLDVGDAPDVDPLAEESPALVGISGASIQGRIALGPRAGARVLQIGREPDAPWVVSRGPCQARFEGFDLHANITVAGDDRAAVERLRRYVLRPPVAQERLSLTPDGLVLVTLKTEWHDGTSHLLFTPVELLVRPTGARVGAGPGDIGSGGSSRRLANRPGETSRTLGTALPGGAHHLSRYSWRTCSGERFK